MCSFTNSKFKLLPSHTTYEFGDGFHKSRGCMKFRIPTSNGSHIDILLDVVDADVPMPIGLDVLDDDGLVVNNLTDKLECPRGN